jgi:hypothetical protein
LKKPLESGAILSVHDVEHGPITELELANAVARRAAWLQGCDGAAYERLPLTTRESFERGALYVVRALLHMGWTLVPPS